MQPIKHDVVTPIPFIRHQRRLPWFAALGLAVALAAPAHAEDSSKTSRKGQRALHLKAVKRAPATAKFAGPLDRLRIVGPALLRLEIVDRDGPISKRIQLELLISNERTANLETQIDRNQYELSVSPASTPGLLRVDVRRRGAESFQVSTLVDPRHPALLSRVGSGGSHTEIRLLGVRAVPAAKTSK